MNLIAQTILGFAFLMFVMGCALFLPAHSMHYWRAWSYLAVFGGCTLWITIYLVLCDRELLAGRVRVGVVAETQPLQRALQGMAGFIFVALFVVSGLDFRLSWSHIPPALSFASDMFVAIGFLIVFLTFRANTYARSTIEVSASQRVITNGPYSVVRHPMYAGAILLLLFTPIGLGSWVALALMVPLVLVIAARIRDEEAFLNANLVGYVEYRNDVRYRLVPYIW